MSVDETMDVYKNWADSYDADVGEWGYATPMRVASALRRHIRDPETKILDFGCGTGLSGVALANEGFRNIDGTDVSSEMLAKAHERSVYHRLIPGKIGEICAKPGDYSAITAMGVISMGAAPPETLEMVLNALAPGGLLAFSYNDATLPNAAYMDALAAVQENGSALMIFDEYGDHLPGKGMKSRVYILEKT